MATNQEQEQYLNDLLADFEESNKLLKSKWDGFMTLFTNNKQNWSDTQYYYFEKRVMEIDQSVTYMLKQIEGRKSFCTGNEY